MGRTDHFQDITVAGNVSLGSTSDILNLTSLSIPTSSASSVGLTVTGASGQTADLLVLENNSGNNLFSVQADADTTIRNFSDSNLEIFLDGGSTAAQNVLLRFRDRGSIKWTIFKDTSNNYQLFDTPGVVARFNLIQAGQSTYATGSTTTDHVFANKDVTERVRIHGDSDKISFGSSTDAALERIAADQLLVTSSFVFPEISAPSAPSANRGILYTKDNGSGKTQLAVRFATGAEQIIATEP